MRVDIEEDFVKVTSTSFSGKNVSKYVSLAELLDKMSTHRKTSIGLLPPNTRIVEDCGSMVLVGVEIPAKKREILFTPIKNGIPNPIEIHLPYGLFFTRLNKHEHVYMHMSSYLFAMTNRLLFESNSLYRYPLPNIHPDGRICWGVNDSSPNTLEMLTAIEGMINTFFTSVFNPDLSPLGYLQTNHTDVTSFLSSLSQSFPLEILGETDNTVSKQIKLLTR